MDNASNYPSLFILVIVAGIIFVLILGVVGLVAASRGAASLKYKPAAILTPAETRFFRALDAACGDELMISLKTRLSDILTPAAVLEKSRRRQFWRITSKHVDFLLIDRASLSVVAAIELDDSSHRRRNRQERDALVNEAFRTSGIPLVRFPVRSSYTSDYLIQSIQPHLTPTQNG